MKVLVVSDTHGRDESLEMAVALEQPFDYLIHCGDVEGREFFIEALAECPCTIVAGNNDFFSDLPREDEILLEGHKIMVTHGHNYGVSMDLYGVSEEAAARGCHIGSYVTIGHNAVIHCSKVGDNTLIGMFALDIPISQWWRRKMVYW